MRRDERRRERWILVHILLLSCLLLTGSWAFFGVLPSFGELNVDYWHHVYWTSEDEASKAAALQHLMQESGNRANRTFSNASRSESIPLQTLAQRWFLQHGELETVEPSW